MLFSIDKSNISHAPLLHRYHRSFWFWFWTTYQPTCAKPFVNLLSRYLALDRATVVYWLRKGYQFWAICSCPPWWCCLWGDGQWWDKVWDKTPPNLANKEKIIPHWFLLQSGQPILKSPVCRDKVPFVSVCSLFLVIGCHPRWRTCKPSATKRKPIQNPKILIVR